MGNEISIIVKAKNMVAAGFKAATSEMHILGKNADKVAGQMISGFKMVATAAVAIGTAVASGVGVVLAAYAKQQEAEKSLAAAFRARNVDVDKAMAQSKALAATMQDQTGAADEATLADIAYATNLGVTMDKMGDAIKMSIALKEVGMEGNQAMRASAMALNGQYSMLSRYIPAIRMATTEEEKANAVRALVEKGFISQEARLSTLSGRYSEMKGRVGDFLEELGRVVNESSGVEDVMAGMSNRIKQATIDFEEFGASGGFDTLILGVKLFASDVYTTFQNIVAVADATFGTLYELGAAPFKYLGNVIGTQVAAWVSIFDYLGAYWDELKRKFDHPIEYNFKAPSTAEMTAAMGIAAKGLAGVGSGIKINPMKQWDDMTSELANNSTAQAQRDAQINADYEKKARERNAKPIAKADEAAQAQSIDALAGIQEDADAAVVDKTTDKKEEAIDDLADAEREQDEERIDAALDQELENVGVVAKARKEAEAQADPFGAAKEIAGQGQAVTPESVQKFGIIGTERASDLEAKRVAGISEALQTAMEDAGQIELLQTIADNTTVMAEKILNVGKIG